MDKEKLIAEIMAEMPDLDCKDAEMMAEMEIKAKDLPHYEQAEVRKDKKPREKKIDEIKALLIDDLYMSIVNAVGGPWEKAEDVQIANVDKEISFTIGNDHYTLTLTKHRNK